MQSSSRDVLVVGAGPVGLMTACELAAAGVSCAVLERRAGESNLTRAFAVHARTLELLDALGLAEELLGRGQAVGTLRLSGGVEVDLSRLLSRFPFVLMVPQYHTEQVLKERATVLGAEIVHGVEVTGLRQDPEGVDVDVRGRDGTTGRRRARYVVGADGVHSTVRDALGLPFPGRSVLRSVMLAEMRLTDAPPDLPSLRAGSEGFSFVSSFGDGWYRVIAWDWRRQLPEDAPVDVDEVRDIVRRTHGTDLGMHDARWLSRFHSDERQVGRYRVGRVFLAGDAAHVHSPVGGLGMNAGLQDAANLGWKLAAVARGGAPDGLLDTYHAERHPVGRSVVRTSGGLLRLTIVRSAALCAVRDAAGGFVSRVGPVADRLAATLSGIGVAYPPERGAHPLAGRRAPDVMLDGDRGPGRLYEALRSRRFVLVAPSGGWADVVTPWSGRVDVVSGHAAGQPLLLVRPDGYVAWASEPADAERWQSALRTALAGWCGPPALTARENEILRLIARGLSNTEISQTLFIAEQTTKTHVGRILSKLGLHDRAQAVVFAHESGLVSPGG